jgi:hypothetical protein
MRWKATGPVLVALGVFAALAGCSDEDIQCTGVLIGNTCFPETSGCTSDQECLPTGVCLGGTCGQECTSDAMCLNGTVCQAYRCVPDRGGPGEDTIDPPGDTTLQDTVDAIPCQGHVDCDPYDMACIDGFCGKECTQDWHCDDPALECAFYQCVPKGSPGEDAISPPEDTGDCPPKDGAYGALCGCKEQCATQLCVQNFLTGQNTCTQYCTGDVNCPGTDICVMVEQGTSICYYNDAGVTPPSCNPDQAGCFKGMVLSNQLGQCACTVPCVDAAGSCPGGMACHFDQQSNQKVCVAVGAPCSTGQNPCYSGSCLGDGQTGYCTAICNTLADCPGGWSCQDVGDAFACVAP